MPMPHIDRCDKLLKRIDADAALIITQPNLRYFSGFTGSTAMLLLTPKARYILTDFRYIEQVGREVPDGFELVRMVQGGLAELKSLVSDHGIATLGIEDANLPYKQAMDVAAFAKVVPAGEHIAALRVIKDDQEMAVIRQACRIAQDGIEHMFAFIRPGMSEVEIALELEFYMRLHGAKDVSFATIVGSGPNGALPHAQPSQRKVQAGDLVVIDFGALYEGYCSDMTRTVAIGPIAPELQKIYDVCLDAQLTAANAIQAGLTGKEAHALAANVIIAAGYGEYFGHGLGHGVGLDIHEAPRLASTSDAVLQSGMVATIEPGIYLPGKGGVRIEDMCLITASGCELLYSTTKELVHIG